jgi:DNA topoisomerase III
MNSRVTSVAGHIFSTDFPQKYSDWSKVDPLSLFYADTIKIDNAKKNVTQYQ